MESTKIRVPAEVLTGLEAVRLSGLTNMLDRPRVTALAFDMGYAETAFWVNDNRGQYAKGIFQGFAVAEPESEAAAPPNDRAQSRHVAPQGACEHNGEVTRQQDNSGDTRDGGAI
ncbi:MAG: DUF5049 domain-containing protein [Armatimonadetes bacterium]|nr:DUF5049 domain-containing protein [Armatimonadota bacterium]